MEKIIATLIDGLNLGSVYALVALGYTMVYGIAKMLNFAHGDVIMVGAYTIIICILEQGFGWPLALLICVVVCALLGFTMEKLAYKPLRQSSPLAVLITAIGVSYLLQNIALLIFGSRRKFVPEFLNLGGVTIGGITIQGLSFVIWGTTIVIMIALSLFIKKTRTGTAMLAVSEDKGAAQLMGINVNSTISFTFAVGSALAGIGSVLYCCSYPQATPTMGSMLGLKAFVAAVLGGIGSIPGAMIGGIAIGLCECFISAIGLSAWKDAVTFAILIIVLLVKPTGFLGRKVQEKV